MVYYLFEFTSQFCAVYICYFMKPSYVITVTKQYFILVVVLSLYCIFYIMISDILGQYINESHFHSFKKDIILCNKSTLIHYFCTVVISCSKQPLLFKSTYTFNLFFTLLQWRRVRYLLTESNIFINLLKPS